MGMNPNKFQALILDKQKTNHLNERNIVKNQQIKESSVVCETVKLTNRQQNRFNPHNSNIWDKELRNGPSEICERQPLKNLK